MLASALGALSNRLDSKFLTAYWLPAFVAVLGGFGMLAAYVGSEQIDAWVYNLDSVEQSLAAIIILLLMTMLAFVLRALTRPIAEIFAGAALPQAVADWSTRGQLRVKHRTAQMLGAAPAGADAASASRVAARQLEQLFPQDEADTQPTLLGNALATAAEHPRFVYAMEGALWWPRLSPLVPSYFSEMMGGAQAPMMALLNLSIIFATLGIAALVLLGLAGGQWVAAIVWLAVGVLLSRVCYRAAVSQAMELGSMLRVAFDLYRHEILTQMNLENPGDLAAERALWQQLTAELLSDPYERMVAASDESEGAKATAEAAEPEPNPPDAS